MSDPWEFGVVAAQFIGWVMVWVFIVLACAGLIIIVLAFLVGMVRGVRSWFPRRK